MWTTLVTGLLIVLGVAAGLFSLIYWLAGLTAALATFFVLTCILMTLVVLIQKPRGGGLSGAFGGAGSAQQGVFGAKVGDALTSITVSLFVLFLGLSMGLVYATRSDSLPQKPEQTPAADSSLPALPGTLPEQAPAASQAPVTPAPAPAPQGAEKSADEAAAPAPAADAPKPPPADGGSN